MIPKAKTALLVVGLRDIIIPEKYGIVGFVSGYAVFSSVGMFGNENSPIQL